MNFIAGHPLDDEICVGLCPYFMKTYAENLDAKFDFKDITKMCKENPSVAPQICKGLTKTKRTSELSGKVTWDQYCNDCTEMLWKKENRNL
ncbi:unnamed protein product [Cylicocyclus nassatus]|uniref:Uncharacterized protein n=1 Tax=Cylicocyclus nassatus TaxID=53992 RepID=A0AA36M069_CYLNA|nr:unnamed protein product [Cylicocyclus nassatus]